MSFLLDANALIALAWPAHEHHEPMSAWFARHAREGWATAALTQAAFVRIVSQPAFAGRPVGIDEAAEVLLGMAAHPRHRLLPLDFGFEQVLGHCTGGVVGHRQVTDAYLLTLAIRHRLRLVTFDAGIAQLLARPDERHSHLLVLAVR